MKYKSLPQIIPILLLLMFAFCIMGNEDNLENRKLATFQMVLNPDEKSITYQESGLERFEAAMKDQFHYRSNVIALYYIMDLQLSRFSKSLFYQPIKGNQQYSYTIVGDTTGIIMGREEGMKIFTV